MLIGALAAAPASLWCCWGCRFLSLASPGACVRWHRCKSSRDAYVWDQSWNVVDVCCWQTGLLMLLRRLCKSLCSLPPGLQACKCRPRSSP